MNQNPSTFDSKTILAIVIIAIVWFAWDSHMRNKYPALTNPDVIQSKVHTNKETTQKETPNQVVITNDSKRETSVKSKEKFYSFENDIWTIKISNRGMGLHQVVLKKYTTREGQFIQWGPLKGILPFETELVGDVDQLYFRVQRKGPDSFVGVARSGGLKITKTLKINSQKYLIESRVFVEGVRKNFKGIRTFITEKEDETLEPPSLFSPALNHQELYVRSTQDNQRVPFEDLKEGGGQIKNIQVAALSSQYFTLIFINRSPIYPQLKYHYDPTTKKVIGSLEHSMLNRQKTFEVTHTSYIGPKDLEALSAVEKSLPELVDFGWFGWIARYLLKLMQFFYSLTGNWGVSIILLTFLVRTLLLPLNLTSYKSMKNMQKVQPLIKEVRKKYKSEPQRMNQEVMGIMRNNKANPLAGCLPMFLQFPIFIALFRVLGGSVDLYQAPFAFWIHDLSVKDPFYVLPILMGLAMTVQMKVTPTTVDEKQKKIMMIMPVMFTAFMLNLPSGLTLYMVVTTVFGVAQHFIFMRDKTAPVS